MASHDIRAYRLIAYGVVTMCPNFLLSTSARPAQRVTMWTPFPTPYSLPIAYNSSTSLPHPSNSTTRRLHAHEEHSNIPRSAGHAWLTVPPALASAAAAGQNGRIQ